MTEVQRATHPRGTAASPPRVLTRKASAGDDRHPRDDERDPSSRVTDGRASPAPPGVRRSRRDLADSAEDLASGAAGSPVKRTREGAPPDNTGPTPASVRAGSCAATEEEEVRPRHPTRRRGSRAGSRAVKPRATTRRMPTPGTSTATPIDRRRRVAQTQTLDRRPRSRANPPAASSPPTGSRTTPNP